MANSPISLQCARQLLPVSLSFQPLTLDLALQSQSAAPYLSIPYSGLIGCERTGNSLEFCYFDRAIRAFKRKVVRTASEEASEQLYSQILALVHVDKSRNLVVFLNPISGSKQGNRIWQGLLKPLLDISGLHYKVYVTTGPDYVPQQLSTLDMSLVTDIVCIGGDGLVHQVLNCIGRKGNVRIGVVPAGSQNALACALGCKSTSSACYHIIKGQTVQGKLLSISLDNGENVLACCGLAWGIVSTIAKQAQNMREFGPAVSITLALRLICIRHAPFSLEPLLRRSPGQVAWQLLLGAIPWSLYAAHSY